MMKYFYALRPLNLIIVATTLYFLAYWILYPTLEAELIQPRLSNVLFFAFTMCALCITAAGNLINDYFDFEADLLYKKKILQLPSRKFILQYYSLICLIGLGLALFVAYCIDKPIWIIFYPVACLFLYLYSYKCKAQGLPGNLIVALFCAGIVAILYFAESDAILSLSEITKNEVNMIFLSFGIFGFLSNIYREIVKDIEDVEGDKAMGLQTLPITMGVEKTKILAAFFGMILMILLGIWAIKSSQVYSYFHSIYIFLFLLTPLWYSLRILMKASEQRSFHQVSHLIKWIMLAGLLYLLFF